MVNECELPYGERSLKVRLPEGPGITVLKSRHVRGLANPAGAITGSLRSPVAGPSLCSRLHSQDKVVVLATDNTRPCPDNRILPPLLAEIETIVPAENITVMIARGLHPSLSRDELIKKLGREIVQKYDVVNHDPAQTVYLGTTSRGNPVEINRRVVEADFRISTGFIEPHFFAGFSGGCKSVTPGVASIRTIRANHSFKMIDHPRARAGVLEGNPVYEDIVEQARLAKHNFIVNVLLNVKKEITCVVSGDPIETHIRGCEMERNAAGVEADRRYDICITTNNGAPLDLDFYQACKGIDVASQVTRQGGIIIVAAACATGIGPDEFRSLHASCISPQAVLQKIKREAPIGVQWQNQILARVQMMHKIFLVSDLDDTGVREMMAEPFPTIEAALEKALEIVGRNAEIAIIPEGPLVLPL
jgi:lactate racemase